uniref:G_PROTEIN_RECEP_F1_2 domain-containing protein n=1 Tax=Panagrellus redivivus TaxID=6233 RepID=A0A7E4VZ35_PANRE
MRVKESCSLSSSGRLCLSRTTMHTMCAYPFSALLVDRHPISDSRCNIVYLAKLYTMDPNQLPRALKEIGHDFIVWYSIETLFNVVTIFNGVIMIMAFVRLHSLHIYFRTVCINVFAFAILRSVIRVITFVIAFTTAAQMPLYYLINAMLFVNIVLNFAQTAVVIERLRSCFAVNVYESLKSRKVICAFVVLPVCCIYQFIFT